ncbi:MAG TPA: dihydropteroate synthase [Chloroflexota bacterium]|nr:dihydropteroate synthase [Chloroflexota bacterium]
MIGGTLGGLAVGDAAPVRVMGVLNVSPESFYQGSVAADADDLARRAERMAAEGADLLDVGAMSTAPFLEAAIAAEEEADRLARAIAVVRRAVALPISVDTQRALPARVALEAGARIVNDVSGLRDDPGLAALVAAAGADLVVAARDLPPGRRPPLGRVVARLRSSLGRAAGAGIDLERVAVDPGIGFTTRAELPAGAWNLVLLRQLAGLRRLGRPVLVGVSRKRFIGTILGGRAPEERLVGSLAAAAVAVFNGAHVVRTHDVGPTLDAVRIASAIRVAGGWPTSEHDQPISE